jgi:GMP synthase (glutamine-hydrolysing)
MNSLKLLLAEGNTRERVEATEAAGGRSGVNCFKEILDGVASDAIVDVVIPADGDAGLPKGAELAGYHGFMMSGSALNIPGGEDDPRVKRQIDLAKAVFKAGVPFWGSCWGLQVAVAAAGGSVRANPKGCEMALARKIRQTEAGRAHALYDGKPQVFDAPAVHVDEIETLPSGAELLATNDFSDVQGATFKVGQSEFWGVQYHPEFDMADMSLLVMRYTQRLIDQGFFQTEAEAQAHAARLQAVHDAPERKDLAWALGIDDDILDKGRRWREIANWVEHAVRRRARDAS